MPDRRLLYMTSEGLQAFRWSAGRLVGEGDFVAGEEGAGEFSRYLARSPQSLYYLVADVIEEDFFQESIPYVRGKDRQTLLGRKLAQRYRDTSLSIALPLGTQEGARREERILFSSFTNTQQFQPWLAALRNARARLVGLFSVALLTPLLARRIGISASRFVLVSLQRGGLRQSYVENGRLRFSRLARGRPDSEQAAATACATESAQIHQYLINLRVLPREGPALAVYVLAPAAQHALYQAACSGVPRIEFHVLDIEAAERQSALKSVPQGVLAERLFLHVLATTQPALQFAGDALRRAYFTWRTRLALLTGGAAVCAFSLLIAGLKLVDAYGIQGQARATRAQEVRLAQEYTALQARFPKTPLSRQDLKEAVRVFEAVRLQSPFPAALFAEISHALSTSPQVELDRLDWEVSNAPRGQKAAPAAKSEPRPPGAAPAPAPGATPHYEIAEIAAHISGVNPEDFRGVKAIADRFVEALRQRPGIAVVEARMPFDFVADRALTGDVGEAPTKEAPRFSLTISRRIGS